MSSNETANNGEEDTVNMFVRVLMVVSLAAICIVGVIGNLAVLAVALRRQNYRFVTNCYVINLALTDVLFLLISVPLTTYLGLTNTWILSDSISCRIHIYFAHVLLQTTCYTLAAMSIDRYFYVTSSHPRPRWRTPKNAFIVCVLIWAASIAFILPYNSLFTPLPTAKNDNDSVDDCSVSTHHPIFASCFFPFCIYYLLPLSIIALSHTKLFFHMRKSTSNVSRHRGPLASRASVQNQRRRVTRTLFSLTCAFAICWCPIHILEMLNCRNMLQGFYNSHASLLDTIRVVAHALSYFNSSINPFLYAFFSRDFFCN